jgi:hypothetical protein
MNQSKTGIQGGILAEAVEMVGKATTMTTTEMDAEKKDQLGSAMSRMMRGNLQEKAVAGLEGIRQGFGLSIANGVERANQALETVREEAAENKAYAIAKGVINVPAQIMRGIVVDTAVEVAQVAGKQLKESLPDLPQIAKTFSGGKSHERVHSRGH